jgi:Domain of unknown function (DUF1992)
MESAMRRLAERRIEEAMREGKFDNLPGRGQPLELEPIPADENARMMWWALRIMKQNDFTPHEVQWRKALDHLRSRLTTVRDEIGLERLVKQINEMVHKINTLGTNAMGSAPAVVPVDLETERAQFRSRLA